MSTSTGVSTVAAYGWWVLVGAVLGVGVAGMLTIGIFVLPVGIVLAVIGARQPALRTRAVGGVLAGVGLIALYIAWLNREGPGTVCHATATTSECGDQWSPWPFVAVAMLLVVISVAVLRWRQGPRRPTG